MTQSHYETTSEGAPSHACIDGEAFMKCPDCASLPRQRPTCKRCNYSGMIKYPCPWGCKKLHPSTGSPGSSSNNAAYGGSTSFSNGGGWGSGQQGYGSTTRR